MKDYIQLAIQTENKDTGSIAERLEKNVDKILPALNKAILAIQELDYTVKKECFYGKPPKYYDAPLFLKGRLNKEIVHNPTFIRLLHAFMGICTEGGEGLEAVAKLFNTGDIDKVNVAEELGDIFWYGALVADECQTTFEKEQVKNIDKLQARHGGAFSKEKVMDRNLAKERAVLENP